MTSCIKAVAAERRFKYVWVRSGEIYVHKLNGSDIIIVNSDSDLLLAHACLGSIVHSVCALSSSRSVEPTVSVSRTVQPLVPVLRFQNYVNSGQSLDRIVIANFYHIISL